MEKIEIEISEELSKKLEILKEQEYDLNTVIQALLEDEWERYMSKKAQED